MNIPRCSKWMPRAKENCAGPENHAGACRTAQRVSKDITRQTIYHRTRYNSDDSYRRGFLTRQKDRRLRYKRDTPDDYRIRQTLTNAKSRCQRLGIPFDLTVESTPRIPERCPVLGLEFDRTFNKSSRADNLPTLDRVIPALGYVPGNVIWISWRANRLKNDASLWELERLVEYVRGQNVPA
jgi:hypothetical protein